MPSRRIALVDDYLDNYHANVFLGILRDALRGRGYAAAGCTALRGDAGRKWAERNSVPYFADFGELNRNADFFMVLAPSTAETHLPLCERVLPFGKPTWVDKTFAPDLATAEGIFAIADRHGAPVETSSALRYTAIQEYARQAGDVRHMIAWCPGGKLAEYLVHPVETIVSCLGPEVERVLRRGPDHEAQVLMEFSRGRTGVANVYLKTDTPYAAAVTNPRTTRYIEADTARLFTDALAGILDFFDSGEPTFDRRESLAIRAVMDAALDAARAGTWASPDHPRILGIRE